MPERHVDPKVQVRKLSERIIELLPYVSHELRVQLIKSMPSMVSFDAGALSVCLVMDACGEKLRFTLEVQRVESKYEQE